jgi:hypothetical protein
MPGSGRLPKPYTNPKIPTGVVPSPSRRLAETPLEPIRAGIGPRTSRHRSPGRARW